MLGPIKYPLDIDIHREIPNVLMDLFFVAVLGVHDPRIVEHHVDPAPAVQKVDGRLDVGFFADINHSSFNPLASPRGSGDNLVDFVDGFGESGWANVGHEDRCAFTEHQDGCFEADATIHKENMLAFHFYCS